VHKFPIDALKIDGSFVRQISTGGEDAVVVKAVITIGSEPFAEGVETQRN
jgi:EAL domain-containing protein (putative c-di-GMP-specific phosphodiesterase class I)